MVQARFGIGNGAKDETEDDEKEIGVTREEGVVKPFAEGVRAGEEGQRGGSGRSRRAPRKGKERDGSSVRRREERRWMCERIWKWIIIMTVPACVNGFGNGLLS